MTRTLTILAAIVAVAALAAPALAGTSKPPPRGAAGSTLIGEIAFPKARGAGVINSLGQKYTAMFGDTPGLSGGDMLVRRPATPRTRARLKTDISDGTSNTMMRSGSPKPQHGIIAILIG